MLLHATDTPSFSSLLIALVPRMCGARAVPSELENKPVILSVVLSIRRGFFLLPSPGSTSNRKATLQEPRIRSSLDSVEALWQVSCEPGFSKRALPARERRGSGLSLGHKFPHPHGGISGPAPRVPSPPAPAEPPLCSAAPVRSPRIGGSAPGSRVPFG